MSYVNGQMTGEKWTMYHGDCVEVVGNLPENSMDYSVFSPPFSSLYTYSDSERDMGNCETDEEFFQHYQFLADQLFRVIKPARLVSVHCMNLPASKSKDGYIGLRDFRGDIIRAMIKAGFIFHSEVCIWKDPVVDMQRTKALGLLHKQIKKDSARSRMGIPDYICTFKVPGDNENPVAGPFTHYAGEQETFESKGEYSIDVWQRYASPVWADIRQTNTLNFRMARDGKDERHICPLQLDVIERCLQMWSNPGDLVLSPFGGVGSEGYQSILSGRRFVGVELKDSYFKHACSHLNAAEVESNRAKLF